MVSTYSFLDNLILVSSCFLASKEEVEACLCLTVDVDAERNRSVQTGRRTRQVKTEAADDYLGRGSPSSQTGPLPRGARHFAEISELQRCRFPSGMSHLTLFFFFTFNS